MFTVVLNPLQRFFSGLVCGWTGSQQALIPARSLNAIKNNTIHFTNQ
jgi:hypothetical protein